MIPTVLMICRLDGYANSARPKKMIEWLKNQNIKVDILNTLQSPLKIEQEFNTAMPGKNTNFKLKDKCIEIIKSIFFNILFFPYLKNNAKKLYSFLKDKYYDTIICVNSIDAFVFLYDFDCIRIYDCPTPWADEQYYGKKISKKNYQKLLNYEIEIYKNVDHVCFNWETYKEYTKKYYNGDNLFTLNWGCDPKEKNQLAEYNEKPKIVFMGFLDGYWSNIPLLSKLSKLYEIDVYGGPKPPKKLGLNYKGYATPEILSNYQFGLITISDDDLRKEGFSAKHLEYINYGLPVLIPEWRKNLHLIEGSIPFNEENFLDVISKYSNKKEWEDMSNRAYEQAKRLVWNTTMQPLKSILFK